MDCEQFDQIVLDLLYGEIAGLSADDAKRHLDSCERCADVFSRLKTVRRKSALPLVAPPAVLDDRLLEAARAAQREIPWPRRLGRAVSWAGSYAMRPQVAMAALLLLMLGSSFLLLRGRSARVGAVRITEHGVPEGDRGEVPSTDRIPGAPSAAERLALRRDEVGEDASMPDSGSDAAVSAARMAESPAASPPSSDTASQAAPAREASSSPRDGYADALSLFESRDYANALRAFDMVAAKGGANASNAALYAARCVRATSGCPTATARFESVVSHYGGTSASEQAKWEAAGCYRVIGNLDRARQLYAELAQAPSNKERAEREMARLTPAASGAAKKATDSNVMDRAKATPSKAAPARAPSNANTAY